MKHLGSILFAAQRLAWLLSVVVLRCKVVLAFFVWVRMAGNSLQARCRKPQFFRDLVTSGWKLGRFHAMFLCAICTVRCFSCVTPVHTYIHTYRVTVGRLKTWAIFLDVRPFYGLRFFIHAPILAPQELGLFCISLVLGLFTTFKPATQMYLHIQFPPHSKHTVFADQLSVLYVLRTTPNAQYIASEMDSVCYFQYKWYIYLPLSFRWLIVVFTWRKQLHISYAVIINVTGCCLI